MLRLKWNDLLIQDITSEQFREWVLPWTGIVSGSVAPVFLSKFGCWFLHRPEGHVEMLDVFTGEMRRMADHYDDFVRQLNEQRWQETFLCSELVFQLHQAGKIPGAGECYALIPHPALGGPSPMAGGQVDSKFVMVMSVRIWQSICAQSLGVGD
jgi:hypothetical protein